MAQRTGQKREYINSYPRKQIIQWWHEFGVDDLNTRAKVAYDVSEEKKEKQKTERTEALRMWGKSGDK